MDLVALGEIADVMDRTFSETNYLMLQGLKNIKNKAEKLKLYIIDMNNSIQLSLWA